MANPPTFHSLSNEVVTATIMACLKDNRHDDARTILRLSSNDQLRFVVDKFVDMDIPWVAEQLFRLKIMTRTNNIIKFFNWCFMKAELRPLLLDRIKIDYADPSKRAKIIARLISKDGVLPETLELFFTGCPHPPDIWIMIMAAIIPEDVLHRAERISGISRYDNRVIHAGLISVIPSKVEQAISRMEHPDFDPNHEWFLIVCRDHGKAALAVFYHPRLDKALARKILFHKPVTDDTTIKFLLEDSDESAAKKPKMSQ